MTGTVLAAACLSATAALAQAAPDEAVTLEDVIVTARKRSERLQDVPVSAAVLGGDVLAQRAIADVKDVLVKVPNVSFPDSIHGNANLNIVIRGISSNTRNVGFESGVGVYIDGVYLGRPLSYNQEFVDIDHVEVLRGPQGTLFGKNNLSGAVNIITSQPTPARVEAGAMAQYQRFDDFSGNAYVNLPLGEMAAFRAVVYGRTSDGYILNVFNGQHIANDGAIGARMSLLVEPSDKFKLTIAGDARYDSFRVGLPETIVDAGRPGFEPVVPGPYTTVFDQRSFEKRSIWGVSATAEYELDNEHTLTSISAYRKGRISDFLDNDNDPTNVVGFAPYERQRHFTQEIRLASPGGRRFDYVVGAYYLDQRAFADKVGILFPPNNIHPVGTVDTESWAVFGDVQYKIVDALSLDVGLRYTREEKKLIDFQQTTSAALQAIFPSFAPVNDKRTSSNLSPTVSLSYKFSDDVTAYAKYSRGFKSGGWNIDLTAAALNPAVSLNAIRFDDEKLSSYEVGVKTYLARRVRLNGAVFYMDYQNQQVQRREGLQFLISNAGSSTIYGAEFDFAASVTEELQLSGGGGYLHAEYDEFTACTPAGASCSGNPLSDAPRWTGNLAVDWRRVVSGLGLVTANVDVAYRSSNFFSTPTADPRLKVPPLTTVDANVAFGPEDQAWRMTFFVSNVFDKLNTVGRFLDTVADPGTVGASYAPPRLYGVRLNFKFGR